MRKSIAIALCMLLPSAGFPQTPSSAVKNSFQEVTSHLDPGGNLFLYLSTDEWLNGLSSQVAQLRDLASSVPDMPAADRQSATRVLGLLGNLVQRSGVEQISGFGMSSIAIENGLYHSKAMLHHNRGNNAGFLWSLFGRQTHALDGLDLLPANTAFAWFSDLDLPLLWSVLNREIEQSGVPGARQSMQGVNDQFAAMAGVDLDKMLASLGGECGFVLTLDEAASANALSPRPSVQIPQVGFMAICKVKDDTIFNAVDAAWRTNPMVIRTNRTGFRMETMPSLSPTPITLRTSVARSEDYLFVASNDAMIEATVAVKAGTGMGLKSTDEFKKLSQRVPTQGNSFTFRSQRIADMMARLQTELLANNPSMNGPAQAQLLTNFFGGGTAGSYGVSANTDEGFLFTGNSGQNPAKTLGLLPTMALSIIIAAVAIPSLLRSRQAANESAAIANLRRIAAAEVVYASSSRGNYAGIPALMSAGLLDARFNSAVNGYVFAITVSGRNFSATATPVSPDSGRYGYFVTTDGVVRYSLVPDQAPPGQSGKPVQ